MAESFDAYHKWLAIPPSEQPANYYRLLSVAVFESDLDVIANAADKQMAHIRSYQTGPHSADSQRILNEISAARVCLLSETGKAAYDEQLRKELAASELQSGQPSRAGVLDMSLLELDAAASAAPAAVKQSHRARETKLTWQWVAIPVIGVAGLLACMGAFLFLSGPKPPEKERPVAKAKEDVSSRKAVDPPSPTPSEQDPPKPDSPKPDIPKPTATQPDTPKPESKPEPEPEPEPTANPKAEPSKPEVPPVAESPEKAAERVKEAFAKAGGAADYRAVATSALALVGRASEAGMQDLAKSLGTTALLAARKAKDDELARAATVCLLDPNAAPRISKGPVWNDLLARIDIERDRVDGAWILDGKAIQSQSRRGARMMLPVALAGEYDLLLNFTRNEGSDTIYVLLPVESRSCRVTLSGWHGACSGLEMIDGREAKDNSTTKRPGPLTNGQKYTLLVEVRLQGSTATVAAELDGSLLFRWSGEASSLDIQPAWGLPQPQRPAVGAIGSTLTVHAAQLRVVSGKASWADGSLLADSDARAAATSTEMAPIPGAAAQEKALNLVREIHKEKAEAATTDEQLTDLAQELLRKAMGSDDDATAQYVLLKEAGRLAIQAKNADLTFRIIEQMATRFQVNAFDLRVKSLVTIGKSHASQQETVDRVGRLLTLMEEAVAREDFDTAKQLGALATDLARKSKESAFIKETVARHRTIVKEMADIQSAREEVAEAAAALDRSPTDPAANAAVGKCICFAANQWARGIPMLALGNDPPTNKLALKELAGPKDPGEKVELADAWWKLGEEASGLTKKNLQGHAIHWYRQAAAGLTGLEKERVEKRLAAKEPDSQRPTPKIRPTRALPQNKIKIEIVEIEAFERDFGRQFSSSQNKAKDGKADASSSHSNYSPQLAMNGNRNADSWCLQGPRGTFTVTWPKSPLGQHILLFSRPLGKGADAWGDATVAVNGGSPSPLAGMSNQKVAILDLGQTARIHKLSISFNGRDCPGLAAVEVHE